MYLRRLVIVALFATPLAAAEPAAAPPIPEEFPRFAVPGHEQAMD